MTLRSFTQTTMVISVAAVALAGQARAVNFQAGDVEVSMYGYARLNMSYDFDANLGSGGTTGAASIGNVNTGDTQVPEGHFNADANQSRLGFNFALPNGINAKIESDFVGGPRLRHAYGTYEGILAGQTWTNFTSFVGNTSTLDFNSTFGLAGFQARFTQLRYTTGGLSVSIEDPRTILATGLPQKDGLPTLTARYEGKTDALAYAVSGLVRQVAYDTGTDDDSAMGYAAFAAAKFSLSDSMTIQCALNYSDGATSYLYISPGPDAFVDASGSLETVSGYAGTLGLSINTAGGAFNIAYGTVMLDLDDGVNAGAIDPGTDDTRTNIFVNYQWKPTTNLMYGVELGRFEVEDQGGTDGDATRLLFAAQYNF